jgi:hypothetical protein
MILSMKKPWPWPLPFLPGDKGDPSRSIEARGCGDGSDYQCQLDFGVALNYDAVIFGGSLWDQLVFPN